MLRRRAKADTISDALPKEALLTMSAGTPQAPALALTHLRSRPLRKSPIIAFLSEIGES